MSDGAAKGALARATAYAGAVVAGEIVAGKLVRLACERHLRDLEQGARRGLWFDETDADRVLTFFGELRHSKGEWAGSRFALSDWQAFILASVFGWKRADGTRRFREAYTEVARKNGKTTLLAGVGLYLTVADREPGAEVYAVATKRAQAKICWTESRRMVSQTPALGRRIKVSNSTDTLSDQTSWSKFEPLGRDSDTQDGLNPHGAILDELHAHPNRGMVDVIETALGARRQPLVWYITTAGSDLTSIWWEKRTYAVRVVEGDVEDDGVFVFIATLDTDDDWRDEAVWIKANPNLGISVKIETLREDFHKAVETPARQNAFRRLRLNQPTEQAERWIDIAQWDRASDALRIRPGMTCYAGLDLASTIDLSSCVALFPQGDGSYDVLPFFWRPAETIADAEARDRVPYRLWAEQGYLTLVDGTMMVPEQIAAEAAELLAPYTVREWPFDAWNAAGAAAKLESLGATTVRMAQGFQSYSAACHLLEGLLASGRIRHGGNPVLRWMANQVTVQHGPNEAIRPYKPKGSGIHDDGIVALLMALARAMVAQEHAGESVYERRGLIRL